MKYFSKLNLLLIILVLSINIGCFDDNDDSTNTNGSINNFIWKGLNEYYLYQEQVPDLLDDRFDSESSLNDFTSSFSSPEAIFDHLKYSNDRFSWLVDDYIALEQSFSGITLNNGMKFGLTYAPNGVDVIGYVQYVIPNSSASSQGVTRGMIFNAVDNVLLTETNYSDLLAPDTYTINLAEIVGVNVNSLGISITLTKTQLIQNPIHIAETITVNTQKIGYLMYNSFTSDFDSDLNNVFASFQAEGITDLVLDLRYNGGGSVNTSIALASMITGQFTGEVFTTEQWNTKQQLTITQQEQADNIEYLTNRFTNTLRNGAPLNSLNLSRVYVLTTGRTASASELIINALNPYINVIQIGTTTVGKYQASITLYDSYNFGRSNANPAHRYAMQPLVLKEVNAVGFTNYDNGFTPNATFEVTEDLNNLNILGDETEPLLARAIQHISGLGKVQTNTNKLPIINNLRLKEHNTNMYIN